MKTKLFKGMLLLFVLLAMMVIVSLLINRKTSETDISSLSAVSQNDVNEDKLTPQVPPLTKTAGINTVQQESNGVYQFHDDEVRVAIEEYMGKESNELTQEDLKIISQITYLNIEGRIQKADDIPILLPNLVGLEVSISEEADAGISNAFAQLKHLEAVKIYSEVVLEPEFAKNLRYVEIYYELDFILLPENNLTEFSELSGERMKEEMSAPIYKYMRIMKVEMLYEMFASYYILNKEDGETYEGERKVSVLSSEQGNWDLVQILDFSSEYDDAISNILLLKDVNYDGKEDILIDNGIAGSEVTFTCYLSSEDGYKKSESFSQIRNPSVDAKEKKILSNWRNSSNSHGYAMYSIENGEYVETERLTIASMEMGENYNYSYQIKQRKDGKMEEWKITDDGKLSSEQFKEQFFSEDSYWALLSDKWDPLFNTNGYEEIFSNNNY